MKYRVIGQNRETGARQVQEFEADSKAAAERKADKSGMSVNRVEEVTEDVPSSDVAGPTARGGGGMRTAILWIIIIAAAVLLFMNWARVRSMLGM